jgi:hypothetical protein
MSTVSLEFEVDAAHRDQSLSMKPPTGINELGFNDLE